MMMILIRTAFIIIAGDNDVAVDNGDQLVIRFFI